VKQVVQDLQSGEIRVEDVPAPLLAGGRVLVSTRASLLSAGTERSKVETAQKSLLGKAKARPDLVKQVLGKVKSDGLLATVRTVRSRLESLEPLGYSSAGVVLEVAPDVGGVAPGDLAACAGAGYANHAEIVSVPQNLVARVPEGVTLEDAAYTTVGAIALQGVRQADVRVGEYVGVIGLGLVGHLVCQIARAAGCQVIGFDPSAHAVERARRVSGVEAAATSGADAVDAAMSFSGGKGVDAVIIAAATKSSEPAQTAGLMARQKGRVVVVGDVGLEIPRTPYYAKELELRMSTSYGPGRYDPSYEEEGHDYPYGYVRWTERRNMEEFLRLLEAGAVSTAPLTTHRFAVDEAPAAYNLITAKSGGEPSAGVLLVYPGASPSRVKAPPPALIARVDGKVRLALIGTGNFATRVLLPAFKADSRTRFVTAVSSSGLSAKSVAERYGFARADAAADDVLAAGDIDAVAVATRHDSHAQLASAALAAGKATFVEKPPAMTHEQLEHLAAAYQASSSPLVVGFNRYFSPHFRFVRGALEGRGPYVATCRVNAGPLPPDSWVLSPEQGGGRVLGEACHFIDLLMRIIGARPTRVMTARAVTDRPEATEDNVAISLEFADGSVGNLVYASNGDSRSGKERIEVFGGGISALIDDFVFSSVTGAGRTKKHRTGSQQKGHREELEQFLNLAAAGAKDDELVFWQLLAMHVTLLAMDSMASNTAISADVPEWLDLGA
jgi:predicted dehydrogenase